MVSPCPDCQGSVSTRAASCPHCGAPIAKSAPVVTIQQTSKHIKKAYLWAGAVGWGLIALWCMFPAHWGWWVILLLVDGLYIQSLKWQKWWENG